ncbi:Decarbamoylnovobiocin carbamoyltransferase [termite gut metagenome]|jgi:carbamoyltransferase|uniref:Decarbamoylnovobiocin carbamoyltransferase n=1 Tax=termite gut metagenome TaxID=433724 RepID=A0A5J4S5Y1_9ZZZZ
MEKIAILGISAYYHDSAAALIVDGEVMAAAQEERFSRKKHDSRFPMQAIRYVLEESDVTFENLAAIVFYDKPLLKFERLLETYHAFAPRGVRSFIASMPVWLKEKLFMRRLLRKHLRPFGKTNAQLLFSEHHLSHAASAFYPSPFVKAAILTIDGVGEWVTTAIAIGEDSGIRVLKEMHFPHSIGLLYSSFTYFLGFKVNSGEYKLMGLAPYGDPNSPQTKLFKEKILRELVDLRDDGSVILNMEYFGFATHLTMINHKKWEKLFGFLRREPESGISPEHTNLAFAIQQVLEEIIIRLVYTTRKLTGCRQLTLAGGVALNCVSNSKIVSFGIFDEVWIQPAAGDAGGALGAALAVCHIYFGKPRQMENIGKDGMKYAYLGPSFSNTEIQKRLNRMDVIYTCFAGFEELISTVSGELADGKIVGWFQDRMEFGPRALGNRSILADPRNLKMQKKLNLKIKFREGFRPFAPSVLMEDAAIYFSFKGASPYMLFVALLKEEWKLPAADNRVDDIYERLYLPRSVIPAVTHLDYSARVQTVSRESNPKFWALLQAFKEKTGIGMLVNTSFNVRGEPLVCTPEDAYRDLMCSEMDCLVMGNFLLYRNAQKPLLQKQGAFVYSD